MAIVITGRLARDGAVAFGWVEVEGGLIARVGEGPPPRAPDLRHRGLIAPGLVDLQVNGAAGEEVSAGEAALARIERVLLGRGVTRWLATVITAEEEAAARAVAAIERRMRAPGSTLAGLHLEGPFLNPAYAGVHRQTLLRAPADGLPGYYRSPALRLVTLAPELPGTPALIAALRRRGVAVSLGHSGADVTQARAAVAAGAGLVTHLFNAMGPMHHRGPGLAGVALDDERVTVGVIADGAHVDGLMLRLVRRLAGSRVALVSDAGPLAGDAVAGPGAGAALGGVPTKLGADGAPRAPGGRLAASAILLDEAVRRWSALAGVDLAESLAAASERPATAVGWGGGLVAGAHADLVLVDDAGAILRTMRQGVWAPAG